MAPAKDHPRSRGVYALKEAGYDPAEGSSPLARGLPTSGSRTTRWVRIIPARAGFTGRTGAPRRPSRDHPRSRGVYQEVGEVDQFPRGSSPLARGLLTTSRAKSSQPMDHPRSRGVYEPSTPPGGSRPGSSPLARGLPSALRLPDGAPRIIPARAGFTVRITPDRLVRGDHPRSRGVYTKWWKRLTRR